jgi:hypothetical protein
LVNLVKHLLQMNLRRERQWEIGARLLKFCELRWTKSLCYQV